VRTSTRRGAAVSPGALGPSIFLNQRCTP
jgi:hypothetical protein